MRNALIAFFSISLLAATTAADEPWLDKSYRSWNQKDIHKILNDSPWAQNVQALAPWLKRTTVAQFPSRRPGDTAPGETDYPTDVASDASQPYGLPPGAAIAKAPLATFLIRWESAKTVRAAEAREAILRGRMQPREAEEFLKQEPSEYELVLVVNPSVGLPERDEFKLQESAHLRGTRTRADVLATRAQIQESSDGKSIEVYFYFPKRTSAGNPSLSPDETEVEFECSVAGSTIRATFHPQKMRTEAGSDLSLSPLS
jgi:hypothetical protein